MDTMIQSLETQNGTVSLIDYFYNGKMRLPILWTTSQSSQLSPPSCVFIFVFVVHMHYAVVDLKILEGRKGRNYYSHFAEVKTEAQSSAKICPRSHIC